MTALGAFKFICCLLGVAISLYALHVEHEHEKDSNYEALCDIGPQASCSQVLTSRYGRGLGFIGPLLGEDHPLNVSNALGGIIFYTTLILLGFFDMVWLSFIVALVGTATSIYLSYILVFVLSDLCLVCLCIYIVNSAILAACYVSLRRRNVKSHSE
ncbi:vitamin K epoxide reductase complex subunit 1-like [Dysidea avara]|uniref:vitamin K epoxide reductase complex subunit 1-like n=1 Tax=Dysidea avara TaxID=196820 RepID=UPI00332DC5BE